MEINQKNITVTIHLLAVGAPMWLELIWADDRNSDGQQSKRTIHPKHERRGSIYGGKKLADGRSAD